MDDCKNIIEDLVIQEIKEQMEALGQNIREKISISDVAAYTLNRLPPLYATSRVGWQQQRQRATTELRQSTVLTIKRGLLAVRRDILREPDPLPADEMISEARALVQVQKVLDRTDLSWNDVPKAVEETIQHIRIRGTLEYTKLSNTRRSAVVIQDYLKRKRSKSHDWKGNDSFTCFDENSKKKTQQEQEFSTYLESANSDFVNVLEKLVLNLTKQYLERVTPEIKAKVNLFEVVAYTLNRLPPMYATTSKGLKQLRLQAKQEHGKVIVSTIHKAVSTIVYNPHRSVAPLPFKRRQGDCFQAFEALKRILNIKEIDCSNVALVIEDALEQTMTGNLISSP